MNSKQACNKRGSRRDSILAPNVNSHLVQMPPASDQNYNEHGSMGHSILRPNRKSDLIHMLPAAGPWQHGSIKSAPKHEEPLHFNSYKKLAGLTQAL